MDMFPWRQAYRLDDTPIFDPNSICQSICVAARSSHGREGGEGLPHLIRTSDPDHLPTVHLGFDSSEFPLEIWRVGRATSAAPFYFPEMKFHQLENNLDVTHVYKDGAIVANNPAFVAYQDICYRKGPPGQPVVPCVLLSVGTGVVDTKVDGFAKSSGSGMWHKFEEKFRILGHMLQAYTKGEKEHQAMYVIGGGQHSWYKRLNPDGIENIALNEWKKADNQPGKKTTDHMHNAVKRYLVNKCDAEADDFDCPDQKLVQVAEKLVRQRRAKAAHAESASINSKARFDTFMGRYLMGKLAPENDRPIHSGDSIDDQALFKHYTDKARSSTSVAHHTRSIQELNNTLTWLDGLWDHVLASTIRGNDAIMTNINQLQWKVEDRRDSLLRRPEDAIDLDDIHTESSRLSSLVVEWEAEWSLPGGFRGTGTDQATGWGRR